MKKSYPSPTTNNLAKVISRIQVLPVLIICLLLFSAALSARGDSSPVLPGTSISFLSPNIPGCTASFDTMSVNNIWAFTNTSISNDPDSTIYEWNFGDGTSGADTTHQVVHTYKSEGFYRVCLTMYDKVTKCEDQFCETILVKGPCRANFVDSTSALRAYFNSTSRGVNQHTVYTWDFGDGGVSHLQNATHLYASAGSYTVCLHMFNPQTYCEDSTCRTVTITQCQASFDTVVAGFKLTVNSTSAGVDNNTRYQWSFGDGGIGTLDSQSHTYDTAGTYKVCLIISNSVTGCSDTLCENVVILPFISTCTAAFTDSTSDLRAYFTSTSTDTNANTTYSWHFGDGGVSHLKNPTYLYAVAGNYTVCLSIVNTATGCNDSVCHSVSINQCQATFDTVVVGNMLTVTSTSTGVDANTTYKWNFGDGGTGNLSSQSHTYATSGTYNVCLTISNSVTGCTDTLCENVVITPFVSTCTAAFTDSTSDLRTYFTSTSTDTNANTTYSWHFGDGGVSHLKNPTHLFAVAGTYTVCLSIANSATGCNDSVCHSVTINQCVASFDTVVVNNMLTVKSTSTGVDANTTYQWSFGDGGTGSLDSQSHIYATTGTYTVCLAISNSVTGCSDTLCENVVITPPVSTCTAAFTDSISDLRGYFTSTSTDTDANTNYKWSFGDGTLSHLKNPTHLYSGAGSYTVCLSIFNSATGCNDSVCHSITINQCQAAFDTTVVGNQLTVKSTSTGVDANTRYQWAFGDGGIGTLDSQSHSYATAGTYNVCLTITNTVTGCSSTVCENVITSKIVPQCQASFDTVVVGNKLTVTSTSTGVNSNTTYHWTFGDGGTGSDSTQSHTYAGGKVCSVPVLLSNSQNSATTTGFQQMITVNSTSYTSNGENANLNNVEFTTGANGSGTPLYAWIESGNSSSSTNTVYWVNLGNSIIPANGTLTVYMNFLSSPVMTSTTSLTGEAPELSNTYGQYDNGPLVFNGFYDNFAGTSLSGNWTQFSTGNATLTINNGLTVTTNTGDNEADVISSASSYQANVVAEVYANGGQAQSACRSYMPGLISSTAATEGVNIADANYPNPPSTDYVCFTNGRAASVEYSWLQGTATSPSPYADYDEYETNSLSGYNVFSLYYTGSNNSLYMNYGQVATGNSSFSPSGNLYFALGEAAYVANESATFSASWARTRQMPPAGVMPTANLESVSCKDTSNTYTVCLTIDNKTTGCTSTTCENVIIEPFISSCAAGFEDSTSSLEGYFTSTSTDTDANTSYKWSFGDGGISHLKNPKHEYPGAGVYTACLSIFNSATGCNDSICQTVTITQCQASFDTSVNGNVLTVTSTSTGVDANTTYFWTFGDGGTGHEASQSHTYANAPQKICSLPVLISNSQNTATQDGFQEMVVVNSSDYAANGENANLNNIEFTTGPNGSGQPLYAWIETGNSSSATNTTYWVNLGNNIIPANGSLTIYMNIVSFTVMTSAISYTGEAPQLSTNYGQFDNGPIVFNNFYDNFAGTSLSNSWTQYETGNSSLVVNNGLTVTTNTGDNEANVITSTATFGSNVVAETYASATAAQSACRSYMPGLISNTASTEGLNIADADYPNPPTTNYLCFTNGRAASVEYSWLQGTTTSPSPYADYDEYETNSLSGFNVFSLYYTGSNNYLYQDYNLVANGNSSFSPSGNLYFALGEAAYVAPGSCTFSSYWARTRQYPPGGTMPTANLGNITCQGTYIVCLTISNSATDCNSTTCESVSIAPFVSTCTASFIDSTSNLEGYFTSTSTDTDANTTYHWYFGDGGISHVKNPMHQYDTAGTYTVCLAIFNSATGCNDSICQNVTVTQCQAAFTTVIDKNRITVKSTSTGVNANTTYHWSFGDGGIGQIDSQSHAYDTSGTYEVCLTITNSVTGCSSTVCDSVKVKAPANCKATFNISSFGLRIFVQSTSTGVDSNTVYHWTFGDDSIGKLDTQAHTYKNPGTYFVCLTINDTVTGCTSSRCDSITVKYPTDCFADFKIVRDSLKLIVISTSTGVNDSTRYRWSFGDDSTGQLDSQSHTYKDPGTYFVCLTISEPGGCTSTRCDSITMSYPRSDCEAFFTWMNVYGYGIQLHNHSKDTTPNTQLTWDLGDGTVLKNQHEPEHRYEKSGTYVVCLTITDTTETYCNSTYCDTINFIKTGIEQLSFAGSSLYYDNNASQIVLNWANNDNVNISLVDILGQEEQQIYVGNLTKGTYRYNVNSSEVAAGMYFVRILANDGSHAWKILILPH